MRIQVVSDLHLEFHNLLPPAAKGADVLVCAGDLAPIGASAVRYAAEAWAEARHILYRYHNRPDSRQAGLWSETDPPF